MKRTVVVGAVATALVASKLWAVPVAASPVPCRPAAIQQLRGNRRETVRLRTFHIEAQQAESFKIGTAAKIDITVTRPAHQDPLDLGVEFEPPASTPADNVLVGVGIHVGDVFVPGFARTDADGKAIISMKLPKYMTPGLASMSVYAWNVVHESPCLRVEEDGYK